MLSRTLILISVVIGLLGCEQASSQAPPEEDAPAKPADQAVSSPPADSQAPKGAVEDEEAASAISWDGVLDLYKKTRGAGEDAVVGAKDSLFQLYAEARESGAGATETSAEWIDAMYQKAKDSGQTTATSAREWALEDYRAHGTREYKLVPLDDEDPAKIEQTLNELGRQRWDCYHVRHDGDGVVLYLKRSRESVLRSLPARDVFRIIPLLSLGNGDGGGPAAP